MRHLSEAGLVDLLVFGDSQVNGGRWKSALQEWKVKKSGHNGFTTSQLLWCIDEEVIRQEPKLCLLQGGINDIGMGIPVEKVMGNYDRMLQKLEKAGIPVILQTVFYVNVSENVNREYRHGIESLNNFLQAVSKENGLALIDINPLICEAKVLKSEFTRDGLHLNRAGYEVWYEAVRMEMQKIR